MLRYSKIVIYGAIAIAVVWAGWLVMQRAQPAIAKYRLKRRFSQIEPWTASTNYSVAGWKHLVETAKAVQAVQKTANPRLAGEALDEYLQRYASRLDQLPVEQAKLFLLLRVVFDLTESGPPRQRVSFGGPAPKRPDTNAGDAVSFAWPLSWNRGRPRLVAGCESAAGSAYRVKDEFEYLRYNFRYRDLSQVQTDDGAGR
jgi:hypothetical protein